MPSPVINLESYVDRLDLEKIFGRNAPLQVDLGCGDGSFLCALAQRNPGRNFLGIERLLGRIRSGARKAAALGNLRLLRMESSYAVRYLLPPGSVEIFYLLFPDPWPKRRHWRRRIFSRDFLDSIAMALEENGLLRVATDHLDYFREIECVSRAHSQFELVELTLFHRHPADETTGWKPVPHDTVSLPLTKFERQFRAQGVAIHWLELRKVSPVR
jgi:tRNA (guanine-N7-)-methyltransferase